MKRPVSNHLKRGTVCCCASLFKVQPGADCGKCERLPLIIEKELSSGSEMKLKKYN